MSDIRSKNTKFEKDFFDILRKSTKEKFSINVASIKGKPDIVFKRDKVFGSGSATYIHPVSCINIRE